MVWGAVQGRIELELSALEAARSLAKRHFAEQAAVDFSGDAVETAPLPDWMPPRTDWFPAEAARALGFEPLSARTVRGEELVMTVGVDAHEDHIHGPVFFLVFYNSGMTFKQGRSSHVTEPGEWFIFDDRRPHLVRETKRSDTYLGWAVPLKHRDS